MAGLGLRLGIGTKVEDGRVERDVKISCRCFTIVIYITPSGA
jgi:hypothetical protein